jgi:glutathione synthase
LDHPKDTTLRLMQESLLLDGRAESWYCDVRSIRIVSGKVVLDAQKLLDASPARTSHGFSFSKPAVLESRSFDQILYRTDPPVDHAYLHPLQMLHLGIRGTRSRIVNPAESLALGNEKFEATRLARFAPESLIASNREALRTFGEREGHTVLKPLHEAQSKGVELLDWTSKRTVNASLTKLQALTADFSRPVILQRYLREIKNGEQRLWFLDGKLLAHVKKRPKSGTFKIDMDHGGTLENAPLTPHEKQAAVAIGKLLRKDGIRMAAVDLIDGLVTDYNHTSPGLLTPMETLLRKNLARPVVEALLKKN